MTKIIAHRGASRAERENTVAAFRRAALMRADAVELDVRRSADAGDDGLVVHHDPRVADGRVIFALRATELPAHVPSLATAMDACGELVVNIEIKNEPGEPDYDDTRSVADSVVELVRRRRQEGQVLVSSFDLETIDRIRVVAPELATAWLVEAADERVLATLAEHGHRVLHPWVGAVTAALIDAAHEQGAVVNTWTCDDPHRMAELALWGIDGICTNVPDLALEVLRHLRHRPH